jgi:hypothetical protein
MGQVGGRRLFRVTVPVVLAALVGLSVGTGAGMSLALQTAVMGVGGNTMSAAAKFDIVPPNIAGSAIAKSTGTGQYLSGSIKPRGSFYIYANVTDPGPAASGVAAVTADVSTIKAGATAVALVAGSYTVTGASFNYRSAAQTADNKAAGSYSYSLRAVDNAGNVATAPASATVDATAPAGSDIQTTNGGTAGRPDTGDTITYGYTEQIDPESILAGWTGASTSVIVRFTLLGNTVTIWNAAYTTQLPLGSVALAAAYVTTATATFNAIMVQSGATVTVTLGSLTSGTVKTNTTAKAMVWTPSSTATDGADDACSTASKTESGTLDVDF